MAPVYNSCDKPQAYKNNSQFICQPTLQCACDNNVYPYLDGDIIPVEYPDGRVKFHYVPKNIPKVYFNSPCNGVYSNTPWLVTNPTNNELNTQQKIALKQLEIKVLETHLQGEAIRNLPPYQLMFHHNASTSTTDLHHFCKTLEQSAWFSPVNNVVPYAINIPQLPCVEAMQIDPCENQQTIPVPGPPQTEQNCDTDKEKQNYKVIFNDIVSLFGDLSGNKRSVTYSRESATSTSDIQSKESMKRVKLKPVTEIKSESSDNICCTCSECHIRSD